MVDNVVAAPRPVRRAILVRQLRHCLAADPAYGGGIVQGLASRSTQGRAMGW